MNQRYYSLDVFRGSTVALMILVNNPGSWSHIFSPFEHANWHGCTPTDLVFPFFLFAVGNSLAFVMPKFEQAGTSAFLRKVGKRALMIFAIGIFLNWSPFIRWDGDHLVSKPWSTIRIFGVLQRIALCYLFGSLLVYFFKGKKLLIISGFTLLLYWWLSWYLGRSGDPYTLPGFFGTNLDIRLLGSNHVYKGEGVPFDPEGPSSTLAAIINVVFGYLTGRYIRLKGKTFDMLSHLLLAGVLFVFAGYCWDMIYPVNKKIWTSSYVLYSTGLAITVLSFFIFLLEFKNKQGGWNRFFDVFGKNPLFIFVLSGFLPRVLAMFRWVDHTNDDGEPVYTSALPWFYEHVCKSLASDLRVGSLVYALVIVAFYWLIAYVLDKKRVYIKV